MGGEVAGIFSCSQPGMGRVFFGLGPDRRFLHFFCRREHRLREICQTIDLLGLRRPSLIFLKGLIDSAQDRFQWNSGFLPCGHQCPVEGRDCKQRSPPFTEVLFTFRVVIKVVVHSRASQEAGFCFCAALLSSQMMRSASRVSRSSTFLMYFELSPIRLARPPVATTLVSAPNSL